MASELEWRRRWKPDLRACPWQPLEIGGEKYLMKTKFSIDNYEVLLTDLTSYWHEIMEENAMKKRIQKLNPSIEAPVVRILDHIKGSLEKTTKGTTLTVLFKTEGDDEKAKLSIKSELAGMPFLWHFVCSSAEKSMACNHSTVPLMAMVAELTRRQKELINIIVSKDKEIDDYKSQGARTSRKHIETTVFDETTFRNNMVTSKGFDNTVKKLGSAAFNTDGQDLYRQIMTKHAWVTRSPTKDDISDSLDDDESLNAGVGPSLPSWANRVPTSIGRGSSPDKSSPEKSPVKSPIKSPAKSPGSVGSHSAESTPTKDTELMRRQALERRLEQDDAKKQEKPKKKKKKLAF
ncbi:non-homologous end-joining factor 1-like [Haliotis cracherodii]|uniref:non-homologous end-joining factor 1-like n=1 Tax=Haliotis cracherodii TaxID=6455 RepID=UPI0039E8B14F